jgi:3alpha(or 20beta)-hydroxysteroid dehydrogenase
MGATAGRFSEKVALITGGAGGIGSATARRMVSEGGKVAIADVDIAAADALAKELSPNAIAVDLDVREPARWAAATGATLARFGRLDVLVNNAGVWRPASIGDMTIEDIRLSLDVNQLGTLLGIQAVVDPMRAGGGGSIVNVSSGAGMGGFPGQIVYASTKWAIRGLTKTAAMELGGVNGIRVNSIHPGAVDTPMVAAVANRNVHAFDDNPVPRVGRPEEIADLILFLACDESSYITGSEVAIDGGLGAGPKLFNPSEH